MSQTCLEMTVLARLPCVNVQTTSFTFCQLQCEYYAHSAECKPQKKVFHFTAAIENFLRSLRR